MSGQIVMLLSLPSTSMAQRLYICLKYLDLSKLASIQAHLTFQPKKGPEIELPIPILLYMLLPIINTKHPLKTLCPIAVTATKQLMKYLQNSPHWDNEGDKQSNYLTRLRWTLESLNGAVEELISLINTEIQTKIPVLGPDALTMAPPFAKAPCEVASKAAAEMCSYCDSGTELMLWMCVAIAALTGTKECRDAPKHILKGASSSSSQKEMAKLKGIGLPILDETKKVKTQHFLTHVFELYAARPKLDLDWECDYSTFLSAFAIALDQKEACRVKDFIYLVLFKQTELIESFFCMSKEAFVTELHKFIHPLFTARTANNIKESVSSELLLQLDKWWPLVVAEVTSNSALEALFKLCPEVRGLWSQVIGSLLVADLFSVSTFTDPKVQSQRMALVFHPLVYSEATRGDLQRIITSGYSLPSRQFLSLVRSPLVINTLRGNKTAIDFLCEILPQVLRKALDYTSKSDTRQVMDDESFMNLLLPKAYPSILSIESEYTSDCYQLLTVLRGSAWADRARMPVPTTLKEIPLPCNADKWLQFCNFDFSTDRFPFLVRGDADTYELSLASWVWLSGIVSVNSAAKMLLCEDTFVTDVTNIAHECLNVENMHNTLKMAILIDTLLAKGLKEDRAFAQIKKPVFEEMTVLLFMLVDTIDACAADPISVALKTSSLSQRLLPHNYAVRRLEAEICSRSAATKVLFEGESLPVYLSETTLQDAQHYLNCCSTQCLSENGRRALSRLKVAFDEANLLAVKIDERLMKHLRILDWVTKVRKDVLKGHTDDKQPSSGSVGVFASLADPIRRSELAISAKDKNATLDNYVGIYHCLRSLEVAIFDGLDEVHSSQIEVLLIDPIREERPWSALLHGFLLQNLELHYHSEMVIGFAMQVALRTLEEFVRSPFPPEDLDKYQYVSNKIVVSIEMQLLNDWKEVHPAREDINLTETGYTLSAIHVKEAMNIAKKLLGPEGLDKQEGPWDHEVLGILKITSEETLTVWQIVISMPSIVKVLIEIMEEVPNLKCTLSNPAAEEIDQYCGVFVSHIGKILKRMRGLGSDASYDVLDAFKHFIPLVTALILTANNASFSLAGRLTHLSKYGLDPMALKDDSMIRMLNENLHEVVQIVAIQGSTTEAGRIKMELARVQKDQNACIAICVHAQKSRDSTTPQHNLSVRLLITSSNPQANCNPMVVSQSEEDLVNFEERVVMLGKEETTNFSQAWRLACELIPLLSEAEWLGLKDGSLNPLLSIALPDPTLGLKEAFYVYSVPVNNVTPEHMSRQEQLKETLRSFIDMQRSVLDQNRWALAFPRGLAADLIASKQQGLPIGPHHPQVAVTLSALTLALGPTDSCDSLSCAIDGWVTAPKTTLVGNQNKLSILWYSSKPVLPETYAAEGGVLPVYFGEALRYAMSRHLWRPLPFELFWCTIHTSEHDIHRLLDAMDYFSFRQFTVICTEALTPAATQVLYKGLQSPDLTTHVLVLTGLDEFLFGQLQIELQSCNVLNRKRGEIAFEIPIAPRENMGKVDFSCVFVTGDYQSGKSHYAKKQAGVVALPHTGDALDLGMAVEFFSKTADPPAVWIDINGYMVTPTPHDPYKLQRLNHMLWMLIQNRCLIDESTRSSVVIPPGTKLFVEVPPSMMFCDAVPKSVRDDPTTQISSVSHLGAVVKADVSLACFDISENHAKVAAAFNILLVNDTTKIRLEEGRERYDWENHSHFDSNPGAVREAKAKSVFVDCFRQGLLPKCLVRSGNIINDVVLTSPGSFASLLQLLYSRFNQFLSNGYHTATWIRDHAPGLRASLRSIVTQTSIRWAPNCLVTKGTLVTEPIFLPTVSAFVTYPLETVVDNDSAQLCEGSKKSRKSVLEELKTSQKAVNDEQAKAWASLSSKDIDLSYVLTGEGNFQDMVDLQKAFDAVGFVTVDDMLIRALHCVERQQSMVPLVIEGDTGVGKSFLLSMMFRIQIQYALRKATTIVIDFLWRELITYEIVNDPQGLLNKIRRYGFTKDAIPNSNWFTDNSRGEQICKILYPDGPLSYIEPSFGPEGNADGFYDRFDEMKKNLADAPVLMWPVEPYCMQDRHANGTPKPRTLDRSMVKFFKTLLASPVDYEYKIVAHPDTRREDILHLLVKPIALAKALRKSRDERVNKLVVPIFIDECNTLVETAGLVKTIMCDFRNPMDPSSTLGASSSAASASSSSGSDLGIWFVGAINQQSDHYGTQVLHPSLFGSVSRFSGITDHDQQRAYIEKTLNRCSNFLVEDKFKTMKTLFVDIVAALHQKSDAMGKGTRGEKFTHLVSQREFHKLDSFIKTTISLLADEVAREETSTERLRVSVMLTAVYYVYIARIRWPEERNQLKRFMEDKLTYDVKCYYDKNLPSIIDAARKEIISAVVTRDAFTIGRGIALTDTLKENVFLSLLACTSTNKNKLSLAIIGDSGMGKTLSNRIVERNLLGANSKTALCRRLPQARFFYIQGATTTTSEQVSKVCERAQKDQQRDRGTGRSTVSFDEASLPKTERLVQKSLHEPIDRKIISIIVLSNKPFDDEANQNRFLVVWNETLLEEEVQELTAGCLEYDSVYSRNTLDTTCPYRPVVTALTKSYFELRESGRADAKHPAAALQMRDYVYLLKYLAEISDSRKGKVFSPSELKQGLEINYGTSTEGYLEDIIALFFRNMKLVHEHRATVEWSNISPDQLKPIPIEDIIKLSYSRYSRSAQPRLRPRFKILIDPSNTYCLSNEAIQLIKALANENHARSKSTSGAEQKPVQQIVFITVSEMEGDRKRSFEAKTLSQLRIAMERGDHVVIRNPERLLSYLFDVLNLNYTTFVNDGRITERAIVALGAETDLFDIDPSFLITFVFSAQTVERLKSTNVPFLSRCEKYLLRIDFDDEMCKPVTDFARLLRSDSIQMFHPRLSVSSAVAGGPLDKHMNHEHIFKSNCKILSIVPPQVFLRAYPNLGRGADYAREYLLQNHFSISELITTAEPGTCTMASTTDTLALKSLIDAGKSESILIKVTDYLTFEELASKLRLLNTIDDSTRIVLIVSSQQTVNADYMWALCNTANELAGSSPNHSGRSTHPYVIIAGAPCNVTAVFSDHWRFVFLDSCSASGIERLLLSSFVNTKSQNSEASRNVPTSDVAATMAPEVLRQFVASYQPIAYTHYSKTRDHLGSLTGCVGIEPIRNVFIKSLSGSLAPSSVARLVERCIAESTDQPFMSVLRRYSKASFLDGAKPLLRLLAGSALIDTAFRESFTSGEKLATLSKCIDVYQSYCAGQLEGIEGRPCTHISGCPESGAYRHPLSSWIVPVIWHRVAHHPPTSTKENGLDRMKEVVAEYMTGIPMALHTVNLSDEEKDQIVLDLLQQCGMLPVTLDGSEARRGYEQAVLSAIAKYRDVDCGVQKKDGLVGDLLFAASTAVGKECGWLRQTLMTGVFLRFLESKGIIIDNTETKAHRIAQSVASSILKSYETPHQCSYVGLSYLFSFLFRTQVVARDQNFWECNMAVLAMLTDLDQNLLGRPLQDCQRQNLITCEPSAVADLSLKALDTYATHCGMAAPSLSVVVWYLAGLKEHHKMHEGSTIVIAARPILLDITYWVSKGAISATSGTPTQLRPFFWPVFMSLVDSALEVGSGEEIETSLRNAASVCTLLFDILDPEATHGLSLKGFISKFAAHSKDSGDIMLKWLVHAFALHASSLLQQMPLGEALRYIHNVHENCQNTLLKIALEVTTCMLLSSSRNKDEAASEMLKLTESYSRPYNPRDPDGVYLLLAYWERAMSMDGVKSLVKTGAALAAKLALTATAPRLVFPSASVCIAIIVLYGTVVSIVGMIRDEVSAGSMALGWLQGWLHIILVVSVMVLVVYRSPPPGTLFIRWDREAGTASQIEYCVPSTVRDNEEYLEIKRSVKLLAGTHPRLALHALREEVFLNPFVSDTKRQQYAKACAKLSQRQSPTGKRVAVFLLDPVPRTASAIAHQLTGNAELSTLISEQISCTANNFVMPALISFIMVEVVTRMKPTETPQNFWEMLLISPESFKGQPTFGDLFGSDHLIHGFDCGAKYDEHGNKEQPCRSIPDPVGQYSLFALLYAGLLAAFLLDPSLVGRSVNTVITADLLSSKDLMLNVPEGLRPVRAAAAACAQHLRFLEQKGYNSKNTLLHLMSTFNASILSPPPARCRDFQDAEYHHRAFAALVARPADIKEDAQRIDVTLASSEWERTVLCFNSTLPGIDDPATAPGGATEVMSLLDEGAHALAITQTAPKIARLYITLNELSSRLTAESDKDPMSITFRRMKSCGSNSTIAAGQEAFNRLLAINGGQLAVECRNENSIPPIGDESPIYQYVSRDNTEADDLNAKGHLIQSLAAIERQVPSAKQFYECYSAKSSMVDRVAALCEKGLVSNSASLWSMYNPSGSRADMGEAAQKILLRMCQGISNNDEVEAVEAAIANFFVIPAMHIQIESRSILTPFSFPKATTDNSFQTLLELKREVRSLATQVASQQERCPFEYSSIPISDVCEMLSKKLSSPKLMLNFLSTAKALLESGYDKGIPIPDLPGWTEEVKAALIESILIRKASVFGFRGRTLTEVHLPKIILGLLKDIDPYFEAAVAMVPEFRDPLSAAATDAFQRILTEKESTFGAQPLEARIGLVDALRGTILAACVNHGKTKPTDSLQKIVEVYGDTEQANLLPMQAPPLTLRCAAGILAVIDHVKGEHYQREHEQHMASQCYRLDMPLD